MRLGFRGRKCCCHRGRQEFGDILASTAWWFTCWTMTCQADSWLFNYYNRSSSLQNARPESEGRWPGCMTSPRTKAFGPFSAGSSAKDSTKSSYSLAASSASFCGSVLQGNQTSTNIKRPATCSACRVSRSISGVPSSFLLRALCDAAVAEAEGQYWAVPTLDKGTDRQAYNNHLEWSLLFADSKREAGHNAHVRS